MTTGFIRLFAVIGLAALAACNTVQGFGEDVEAGGSALSDTAAETEAEIQN